MNAISLVMPWSGTTGMLWSELVFILLSYMAARCLLLQLPLLVWVTKAQTAQQRRIYKIGYRKTQIKAEVKALIGTLVFDSLFLATMVKSDLAVTDESHILTTFLFSAVFLEVWFYVCHRALHTRLLFPIHRLHHSAPVNSPLTAVTFSLGERLLTLGGLCAGLGVLSLFYPIAFAGVALYFGVNYVLALILHTNIEIYPPSWRPILAVITTPTHHSLHHSRLNGNFGLYTRVLDRIFKTEFSDYAEIHERAYGGDGLTSLGRSATKPVESIPPTNSERNPRLCDVVSKTDLRRRFVFESPAVRAWLAQELTGFTTQSPAVETGDWYIERGKDIFGPLSFAAIVDLKGNGHLKQEDCCFSLEHRTVLPLASVPAPSLSVQTGGLPHFLNRRKKRTKLHRLIPVQIGAIKSQVMILDVNEQCAAIYLKSVLELGEAVVFEFPEQEAGEKIQMKAFVVNKGCYSDGYRYGLRFERFERRMRTRLNDFINRKLPLAA